MQEVGDPIYDTADGKSVQKKEDHDHVHLLCKLIKFCHILLPRIFFEWAGGSGDCRPCVVSGKIIVVILSGEIVLGTALATQRLPVGDLLQVVQPTGDAPVAVGIKGIQVDAGPAVNAGVHLGTLQDGVQIRIHDAGSGGGVGVDEVRIRIDRIVGAFCVAVTQRGLDDREGGDSLAVALQLGLALLIGCLDRRLDGFHGLLVGFRDNQADAVLGRAAIDALGPQTFA